MTLAKLRQVWQSRSGLFRELRQKPKSFVIRTSLFTVILFTLVGLSFVPYTMDLGSAQAGLAAISEVLGVFLGVVLVAVVLVVEQGHEAGDYLTKVYPHYFDLLNSRLKDIASDRDYLLSLLQHKKIGLDDPVFALPSGLRSGTKFREVVAALYGLSFCLEPFLNTRFEEQLSELGYSDEEIDKIRFAGGALAHFDPVRFLELVQDAFPWLSAISFPGKTDLATEVFRSLSLRRVDSSIRYHRRSRALLRSKTLRFVIACLTVCTLGAIMTLFRVTEHSIHSLGIVVSIRALVFGFVTLIVLSLLLVERLLEQG